MPEGFLSSEEYDEAAHKLYNDGDYDGALEMLKEGLSIYPNAVELYVGLGIRASRARGVRLGPARVRARRGPRPGSRRRAGRTG